MQKRVTSKDYTREYFELELLAKRELKDWARERINNVLSFTEPSKQDVIADIGCGTGTFARECAKRGSYVYAVDFSRIALKIARKASEESGVLDKIAFINSAAEAIPLKESSVNKTICADLVEHLYPDQFEQLLKELFRIIQNQGQVIIYTPSPRLISKLPRAIRYVGGRILGYEKRRNNRLVEMGQKFQYLHVHLKSARFLKRKLKEKEFEITKMVHTGTGLPWLEEIPLIQDFLGGHTLIDAKAMKV